MFSKTGPAVDALHSVERFACMKRAHSSTRSRRKRELKRLVVAIGQIHPVSSGRFSYFLAKRIGKVQSWIFQICHDLVDTCSVTSFGAEGYSEQDPGIHRARVNPVVLESIQSRVRSSHDVYSYLIKQASIWRKAVHKGDQKKIRQTLSTLDGVTVLQALHPRVSIFPIEQKDVHGVIGEKMKLLAAQMTAIDRSSEYISAKKKGGKNLTKQEYSAVTTRNTIVKEYNKTLKHPDREKSILREVMDHAAHEDITVFVLGQAHKREMLRLAKKHIDSDVLFVWITPPQLWQWWKRSFYIALVIVVVASYLLISR